MPTPTSILTTAAITLTAITAAPTQAGGSITDGNATFTIVTGVTLVSAAAWFFARPLLRKVTDEQVALYLEEHEPSLESTILTALAAPGDAAASPVLVQRMIETALERVHAAGDGARIAAHALAEQEADRQIEIVPGRAHRQHALAGDFDQQRLFADQHLLRAVLEAAPRDAVAFRRIAGGRRHAFRVSEECAAPHAARAALGANPRTKSLFFGR